MKPEIRIHEIAGRTVSNITFGDNGQAVVVFEDAFTTLGFTRDCDNETTIIEDMLDFEDFGLTALERSGIMSMPEAEAIRAKLIAERNARIEASDRFNYERLKAKYEPEKGATP